MTVLVIGLALLATATGCGGGNRAGDGARRTGKIFAAVSLDPCAAAVQRDGKILVVGGSKTPTGDFALTRYLPDGRRDRSFGGTGTVLTAFGPKRDARGCAVGVQPDGRIVVAGGLSLLDQKRRVDTGDRVEVVYLSDIALARYLPDGRLDLTFGRGGKAVTNVGPFDSLAAIALQADGKVVAAGASGKAVTLLRYSPQGRLDPTFGTGGKVVAPSDPTVTRVAIDRAGRIILAGGSGLGGTGVFGLARYTPDGVLDQSFGRRGTVRTGIGPRDDYESYADDLAIQADGKIVASGYGEPGTTIALARYSSEGRLDGTFGKSGKVVTIIGSISAMADAEVVAIQPDGRILASGGYEDDSLSCALVRYEPNGSLDTGFGKGGKVLTRFGSPDDQCNALAVQSRQDGRIVFVGKVAGAVGIRLALARYSPNGQLDPSFGRGGELVTGS